MKRTYILGISAFYHDSAACLVKDGKILSAVQEERFTRKKHDFNFPAHSIKYCLEEAGIDVNDLSFVGFYDKPFIKFERILYTYLNLAPWGLRSFIMAMPLWLKQKLFLRNFIQQELGYNGEIIFTEHHESHAASAFYPSPFKEAAILTMDGVGEWTTASFGVGEDNKINLLAEIKFPHSLGLLYSAFTYYIGFKVNSGEYKVMGLAPYGEPKYVDIILNKLINLKEDGSFKLNMEYFNYCSGLTMTNSRFNKLFGGPPRKPETLITQKEMDLARSIQVVTEEIMLRSAKHVFNQTGKKNLCLAGGVALNCVGNGRILKEGPFENIWIQPAAGDAGGALGVALFIWYRYLNNKREPKDLKDFQRGSYLGPYFSDQEIEECLIKNGVLYERLPILEIPRRTATLIKDGYVVGWFEGRVEFGPRALGSRSILGDARSREMQSIMNLKIKFRESFRPFAPSVLEELSGEYFDIETRSPYMLLVASVKEDKRLSPVRYTNLKDNKAKLSNGVNTNPSEKNLFGIDRLKLARSSIPAVTHLDYSARIQTVSKEDNPLFYDTIKEFYNLTDCPVIINTSFNVRGEPIVCKPQEALNCFLRTEMDYLVMGSFLIDKKKQNISKEKVQPPKYLELD